MPYILLAYSNSDAMFQNFIILFQLWIVYFSTKDVEDCINKLKEGIILKLDFKKAYDLVDWDFLDKLLDE